MSDAKDLLAMLRHWFDSYNNRYHDPVAREIGDALNSAGLAIVPAADVPSAEDRAVLEACTAALEATIARARAVQLWSQRAVDVDSDDGDPLFDGMQTDEGGQWIHIDDLIEALREPKEGT